MYPVTHIQDFSGQLCGKCTFSKIDLVRGYRQILATKEDIHKMAVITPFGFYEFLRTLFGLKNAVQSFQRLMDSVHQGLEFVLVYLDNIHVASQDRAEQRAHPSTLFNHLKAHGLVFNPGKWRFIQSSLKFLGHLVTAEEISPAHRTTLRPSKASSRGLM